MSAIAKMHQVLERDCGLAIEDSMDSKSFNRNVLNVDDCGKVSFSSGFVIGGTKSKRGQWPFLVAVFNLETNKFFCGGNLITSKNVLTGN